jgi:nitrate/nitrite transporter NarK
MVRSANFSGVISELVHYTHCWNNAGLLLGTLSVLPTFFEGCFNVGSSFAGYVLFGYGCAAAASSFLAGFAVDKFNIWVLTAVFLSLGCAGYICLAASSTLVVSIVAVIVIAMGTIFANTCCYKLIMISCQASMSGTIGWMETAANLTGFLLPLIWGPIAFSVGVIARTQNWYVHSSCTNCFMFCFIIGVVQTSYSCMSNNLTG